MRLFVYGTLQFPEVLQAVTGCRLEGERAVLDGYACYTVAGKAYPGIIHKPRARTGGLVYSGIGESHFRRLDNFEGDLYERIRVCVTKPEGNPLQAWVYAVRKGRRAWLTRMPWSKEEFEAAHLPAFLRKCRAGGRA